jgi:transcriptional regulator with XRE-family HTH domain
MHVMHAVGMKLDHYIKERGVTEQELATATGYSQGTINKLRNGKINPTLELLTRVTEATNGAVTPNDFLPPFRSDESPSSAALPQAHEAQTSEEVSAP